MGKSRNKTKKLTVTNHEEPGSGEEEKIPLQKKRGRPLKLLKDEIVQKEEAEKVEHEDVLENAKSPFIEDTEKKRKRDLDVKEKPNLKKEESGNGTRSSTDDVSTKSNGFRHTGHRRKSTPRRAAESGVLCN